VDDLGGSTSTGPDWERVAFDVACGRCGEDLRGCVEPSCPRCELTFEWDDVLPLEELRCLHCAYLLIGLQESRCPECGQTFEWPEVLDAARARKSDLFEHQWSHQATRALSRTWWLAAFRPTKLWASHDINDPPRVGPLLAFAIFQWAVFVVSWFAGGEVADLTLNRLARWKQSRANFNYDFRLGENFFYAVATAYLFTFLSFQLFFQTNERYRVRWQQLLRVYVHATAFASLCLLFSVTLEAIVDASVLFIPGFRVPFPFYDRLQRGVLALGVLITWAHIWCGYHVYLKIPRGWGTAAMCPLVGYLLTKVCWDV